MRAILGLASILCILSAIALLAWGGLVALAIATGDAPGALHELEAITSIGFGLVCLTLGAGAGVAYDRTAPDVAKAPRAPAATTQGLPITQQRKTGTNYPI